MTFETERIAYSKEHIYIIEVLQDFCDLVSGTAPCTATETGDAKCYNTLASCNDVPNFDQTTKTYSFCTPRSPHPAGLDAIPSLLSVSITPAQIDLQGGLGTRSNVSLTFSDQPSADISDDPYLADRTYIASDQGTFWTKWRSRNPHYQGRTLRVLSGYLVDGAYDATNFTTRTYIIDKLDVTKGKCTIVGKDPLKLADSLKAKAPAPSAGLLSGALTAVATTVNLVPTGIGSEYPSTGFVRVKGEVMEITSKASDALTVVRGQYNTTAAAQSANDTVQLCLEYDGVQVDDIVEDLLTTYAGIDSAFIPTASWAAEADIYLTGLLSALITEPTGVGTLLKELGEQAPHSLYWDERSQKIEFIAVKPPPASANVYDMSGNLLEKSVSIKDEQALRISTVIIYFGLVDPTQKLDELNNYAQIYARIDPDSITAYGSDQIKTIHSRWVTNLNKTAALLMGERLGRRFSNMPRSIMFAFDTKDGSVWAGDTISINHRDMVDFAGVPEDIIFQVVSAHEGAENYKYKGIEFGYGAAVDSDDGAGDIGVDLITIGANQENLNMRTAYDSLFPAPDATTVAKIVIEAGVEVGSIDNLTAGFDTGSWPVGAVITIENRGFIVGRGGVRGGTGSGTGAKNGTAGGLALNITNDVTIDNFGVIGGGGGGGGSLRFFSDLDGSAYSAIGGDGAGYIRQIGPTVTDGEAAVANSSPPDGTYYGGYGGDLGVAGGISDGYYGGDEGLGGAAGAAIDENGNSVTYSTAGTIEGVIIP